jgi:hypothetical protein
VTWSHRQECKKYSARALDGTPGRAGSHSKGPTMSLTADVAESGEVGERRAEGAADEADESGRSRPAEGRLVLLAVALAVLPFLVAAVRGIRRGWQPTGDDAFTAIRAWDVFSSNPPLLGTWSSASAYMGRQINHPGPLHFDLLAVPVRLLGHAGGTALGTALVNVAAVVGIAWLVRRRMGSAAAALATGFCALLAWSQGSEMLYEPWSQYAPLWPFALFLVAAWCAVAGDVVALPVMVVAGSVALQTHLSYALLVPGLAGFVVVVGVVVLLRRRRSDPGVWPARRRRALRWGLVTLAAVLLTWAQPLVENFAGEGEGNLYALAGSSDVENPTPTTEIGLRVLGGTVALPPAWLPPSYGSPAFDFSGSGRSVVLCTGALVALAGALALLGWRAGRRGSRAAAAGAGTALVALGLAVASVWHAPVRFGLTPNYFRWLWPLGMVVWLALATAVVDEVRHQLAERRRSTPDEPRRRWVGGWVAPGLALTAVAAVAALPRVDNGVSTPVWADEGATAIDDDVVAAVEARGGGPVLVDLENHVAIMRIGFTVMTTLQAADIPFLVRDDNLVRQLGTVRRWEPGEAAWRLVVKGGEEAGPGPAEELVAEWRDLTGAEQRELARLEDDLADRLDEHGLPLTDDADEAFEAIDASDQLEVMREQAADDTAALLDNPSFREMWSGPTSHYYGHPLIDDGVIPADLLDRWSDLKERSQLVIRVYMSPLT